MSEMDFHAELSPLAAFLHQAIDRSPKTQRQLAQEIGFKSANMIAMLKHDTAKFPLDKVVPAAIALNVDVARLLHLVLEQNWPRKLHLIESVLGLIVTANERTLVTTIRRLSRNTDPNFSGSEITAFVKGHDPR